MYSDCAWSDTPCNNNNNNTNINNNLSISPTSYLTAGELNLMSRFSSTLNSSLALNSGADSDATSSSTSSSSATTNNSSNSLSLSPASADRDILRSAAIINNNNIKREEQLHISNHLLELQKEIKEEEEEIFDLISRLYSNSTLVDEEEEEDDGEEEKPKHQHFQLNHETDQQSVHFLHHEDDDNNYLDEGHHIIDNEIEDEHINYMEEHTFASCSQVDQQDYQKLQEVIQQVTSNLPKPCVFFLEGNCRRSDCKYSHDLSNIICKYWIDGFCFKGELCPFLHSYTPNGTDQTNLLGEDGLQSLSKKQLNPTFVIESEADFPSLPLDAPVTVLNDSCKSSIDSDTITTTIKNQILSSNPAVVFKTVKKKRKRG